MPFGKTESASGGPAWRALVSTFPFAFMPPGVGAQLWPNVDRKITKTDLILRKVDLYFTITDTLIKYRLRYWDASLILKTHLMTDACDVYWMDHVV